jgi:alkylation response protein AidB-like acyl-CoA dehydrogenase
MRRLTDTDGLTEFQRDILRTVRDFVDAEVLPVASELDHADAYPDGIVTRLKELGVFGLTIDEQYGGLGESLLTYALVVEELARGWMSLSCRGWRQERSAARCPCRNRTSARTSPRSAPPPGATATIT